MARIYGPRPELGYRLLHGHEAPLRTMPSFMHVSETVCSADHTYAAHCHEVFELCYIVAGKGERVFAGQTLPVEAGDLCIAKPGESHSSRADRQDPYHCFAIAFHPDLLTFPGGERVRVPGYCRELLERRVVHGATGSEHILRRILAELDRVDGDPQQQELTAIQVTLLVLELLVLGSRCALAGAALSPTARSPRRRDFIELLAWLSTRLSAPPSLPEMAARVGLTPAHFTVAFKREMGTTPIAHLLELRVAEAARRLTNDPATPITRLAFQLGFASSQHFSQVFRERTGSTPSAWRRRQAAARQLLGTGTGVDPGRR